MTQITNDVRETVRDNVRSTRDSLHAGRAFGTPIEQDGLTVIPVARVAGGAGGGGGESTGEDEGSGFGTGFGLGAQPVGVFEIRDGRSVWRPAIDVNRFLRGMQVLAGIALVCATLKSLRRQR